MAEYIIPQNQEQQVKKLKRLLEGWRMVLLPLKSIMVWEQQWHPCAIMGSITIFFLLLWLMDLNTLTTFALIGIFLNFIDFFVPVVCNSIYGPNSWTGHHEKMFEDICRSIVANYNKTLHNIRSFYTLRDTSPLMYHIISVSILCTLVWLASTINNIFLLYILSTVILLWPGIQERGIFNTMLSLFKMAPKKPLSKSE